MLGQTLVVDAVVHPYDLGPDNQIPPAREQLEAVYAYHRLCTGPHPDYVLAVEEFFIDFDGDDLTEAIFAESPVDLAIIHALPNLGFTKGGVTDPGRMAALRDRYPGRYLLYATVDTPVTGTAIAQLEAQVRDYGVDGLKLYPAFFYDGDGHGWRLDGPDFATPLLEAAVELGIRNVAVHKAVPVPPAPEGCFRLDDVGGALERFPQVNFHLVHAGVAFLPETAALLAGCPNVYANLESTFAFLLSKPRVFAGIIGRLLQAGGAGRLLFGSGANLTHPRPLLEAFEAFEMPEDLVAEHGFPELSAETRALILGGNALRTHGLDADAVRRGIEGDAFEAAKAAGFGPPWRRLRSRRGTAPAVTG
ncbi:MAG TPA: amidohydrolase family protein [Actinomycetota bacterium]|nr:amidohydrolase family protein [Actinomycetota bacterium]